MSLIGRNVRRRNVVLAQATGALLVAGLALAPASARPLTDTTAQASPASTASVTVRPDPSYAGEPFEGWGTSLVWFANATGGYPDEIRNRLADMVFGKDGLNLNIARYNIGGGNAPDVPGYLRAGGAVDGWWQAPAGTTRQDVDWWDAQDTNDWNDKADANQRWWVDRIKNDITHWEAFSNSPPWFMTKSGYVSGGFDANTDQLKTESIDDFAAYLVGAVKRLEDADGITVDTIDPFNEPNTNYWGTQLGADGNPTGGRQEGAHMGTGLQQQVIPALTKALASSDTGAVISAMDETNPGQFAANWNAYSPQVRDQVGQLNVHTYGTGQRTSVRDIAKGENKPLWMSEVGGSWSSTGQDFTSMESGLGSAHQIANDLRELEPSAWVFWQPVEDLDNMSPGGESPEGGNWGEIQISFSCTADDTLETCPIRTNTKYWVTQNFTHYITPGDRLIGVDNTDSTAAISAAGDAATVVHINDTKAARQVTLDLSGFANTEGATITPVTTSADGYLKKGSPTRVTNARASLSVPAESVTTFVIDGVSGVADGAALAQDGHVYRLDGVQSGRSLAPDGNGGVHIETDDAGAGDQLWKLTDLGAPEGEGTHRSRYAVTNVATGQQLAVSDDGSSVLTDAPAKLADTPEAARWVRSTTGDGTSTLINAASGKLLDVGNQATADGSPVGTYQATSGANQRWTVTDETVLGIQPVEVFTTPGTAPKLPATITPIYASGPAGHLPVTWDMPAASTWAKAGTVQVNGTVALPSGGTLAVEASVIVDTLVRTEPAHLQTYAGGDVALPATVNALTKGGHAVARPVTWQKPPAGAFAKTGVVELTGTADDGAGGTLAATARVLVTEPGTENAALASGTKASATYTESGYSPAGVINGVTTDKGWSNWRSDTKDTQDTLTITLPAARDITSVVTHFFADGDYPSWASALRVEAKVGDGWQTVGQTDVVAKEGAAPVVEIRVDPDKNLRTDAVRVVMTAQPLTHMTVSEIEVLAKVPGKATPAWDPKVTYDDGDIVFYDGGQYRATWWTQNEKPGTSTTGAWQELLRSADGTAVWTNSRIYDNGDRVVHNGKRYVAKWWTRDQEPGDRNGPWALVAS